MVKQQLLTMGCERRRILASLVRQEYKMHIQKSQQYMFDNNLRILFELLKLASSRIVKTINETGVYFAVGRFINIKCKKTDFRTSVMLKHQDLLELFHNQYNQIPDTIEIDTEEAKEIYNKFIHNSFLTIRYKSACNFVIGMINKANHFDQIANICPIVNKFRSKVSRTKDNQKDLILGKRHQSEIGRVEIYLNNPEKHYGSSTS